MSEAPYARDRCEVCARSIEKRPVASERRCGVHLDVMPLFPVSLVQKSKRGNNFDFSGGEQW